MTKEKVSAAVVGSENESGKAMLLGGGWFAKQKRGKEKTLQRRGNCQEGWVCNKKKRDYCKKKKVDRCRKEKEKKCFPVKKRMNIGSGKEKENYLERSLKHMRKKKERSVKWRLFTKKKRK